MKLIARTILVLAYSSVFVILFLLARVHLLELAVGAGAIVGIIGIFAGMSWAHANWK